MQTEDGLEQYKVESCMFACNPKKKSDKRGHGGHIICKRSDGGENRFEQKELGRIRLACPHHLGNCIIHCILRCVLHSHVVMHIYIGADATCDPKRIAAIGATNRADSCRIPADKRWVKSHLAVR